MYGLSFSFFFEFFFYFEPGTERPVRNRGVPAGIRPELPVPTGILTGTKTSPFCSGFASGTGRSGRSGRNGTEVITLVHPPIFLTTHLSSLSISYINPISLALSNSKPNSASSDFHLPNISVIFYY